MKIILDCNNIFYYKNRAIEAIHTGDYLLAIRLLAIILMGKENGPVQSKSKKKTRDTNPKADGGIPQS
jgi:hypothetical protein